MGWEAAPTLDPATGRPHLFRAVGARHHAPMWAEGVRHAIAAWGPWVGLLVSRHGTRIYGLYQDRHRGDPRDIEAADAYLRDQAVLRKRLLALVGATESQLETAAALVAATDALSLAVCGRIATLGGAAMAPLADGVEVRLALEEDQATMTVEPWPFAQPAVHLSWSARRFPPGTRWSDEAAMRAALTEAPVAACAATLLPRR
jgi:hypothetical protein